MTGRERFEAIIDGKKPDRLPVYFTAVACTVASEILGREVHTGADSLHFKEELAIFRGEEAHREFDEKHLEDVTELWRTLGVDVVREVWRSRSKPSKQVDEYTLLFGDENKEYIVKRFCPETQSYGILCSSIQNSEPEDLAARLERDLADRPELPPYAFGPGQEAAVKLFSRMGSEYGQMINSGGVGFSFYDPLWLELLYTKPDLVRRYLMRHARREGKYIRQAARQGFRWFSGGGDLAGNNGPMISPQSFREVFVPPIKYLAETCARLGVVYCYRSDGMLWPIFNDMFGTAGVQAYGEADRSATMTVGEILKQKPGLIVLGNTSSALLVNGTVEEIREDTRNQLAEADGCCFIPGPSNAVVHGTPVRNVFAMLEELTR